MISRLPQPGTVPLRPPAGRAPYLATIWQRDGRGTARRVTDRPTQPQAKEAGRARA